MNIEMTDLTDVEIEMGKAIELDMIATGQQFVLVCVKSDDPLLVVPTICFDELADTERRAVFTNPNEVMEAVVRFKDKFPTAEYEVWMVPTAS